MFLYRVLEVVIIASGLSWQVTAQQNLLREGVQSTNDNSKNNCRPEFRRFGDQSCLDNILRLLGSDSAFWFGTGLENRCTADERSNVNNPNCYLPNSSGPRKYSILDRLFSVPPNIAKFDRFLGVQFDSPEGNYTACGGDFQVSRRGVGVNPDMEPTTPWFVRNPPTFSLQVDQGTYYTILTMDPVTGNVLGALMNYPWETQDIIRYRPLLYARNATTPVVFLAYRQNARIQSVNSRWAGIMSQSDSGKQFDLSNFALDQQLTGPVSANIMQVNKDAWAAQANIDQRNGPNFCAEFISEALGKSPQDFIQRLDRTTMDSFLTLGFSSSASSFTVCCSEFTYSDSIQTANPLSDKTLGSLTIRAKPEVRISRANGAGSDRLYTIIAVDPSTPKNALSTPERPFALWLAVNVKENGGGNVVSVGSDSTVLDYSATIPAPQSPPHTLYFFLFEQTGQIQNLRDISKQYSDPLCADFVSGRCLFQISNFTQNNGLILRAASWITVVNDAYARFWMIKSGQVEWDICSGQPNYRIPCPRPGELTFGRARVTEYNAASTWKCSIIFTVFLALIAVC